ncbi:MAG TPA: helix-turn-helix domain-containing protein, partial [Candidatus Eremiobacteraeota bacterium]|nr:helix-turn-helix domain-containing protein [Candidatus Eremiobacteraeota bacterium]
MKKDYYEINEAARELGKSRATINKYIKSGKLKATKVKYRRIFKYQITAEDLEAFRKEMGMEGEVREIEEDKGDI